MFPSLGTPVVNLPAFLLANPPFLRLLLRLLLHSAVRQDLPTASALQAPTTELSPRRIPDTNAATLTRVPARAQKLLIVLAVIVKPLVLALSARCGQLLLLLLPLHL